jgi:glycerol-3-phosphate acyltransferase PlsY
MTITVAPLVLVAFLSGSVPWALVLGKLLRGIDVRQHGSKNIGATNAVRVLGRPIGYSVFALDAIKGAAPVVLAGWLLGTLVPWHTSAVPDAWRTWCVLGVAVAAVLGHVFSPWVGFRGGKGVATGFGALAGVWPTVTLAAFGSLLIWVILVKLTRYVSIASIAAALSMPVLIALIPLALGVPDPLWRVWPELVVVGLLASLVTFKHHANIARLRAGTEPQIGQPQISQPQIGQPQISQPQIGQPQISQPQIGQAEVAQPGSQASA